MQTSGKSADARKEARKYIVRLDSYAGDQTALLCSRLVNDNWENTESLYCVIAVSDQGAEIVDYGYDNFNEAQRAWPQAI